MNNYLFLASAADAGGCNIRDRLIELGRWKDAGLFSGMPVFAADIPGLGRAFLATASKTLLESDFVENEYAAQSGVDIAGVVFLSKHKSESQRKSLTVHPVGNFGAAEFGGRPGQLSHSMPAVMTEALRRLKDCSVSEGAAYSVSFEVTHHGPMLGVPSFFIEIGSTEEEWSDRRAGAAIAEALLGLSAPNYPVAVGIGGGHYAPRHTDIALSKKVSFGHIIPSYAVERGLDGSAVQQAAEKTPGATIAYFHRKAMKKTDVSRYEALAKDAGLRVVREDDLEALQ